TVQRAVQRVDTRGNRGELVDTSGTNEADGRGRRVLLVVFVQDEQALEGTRHDRVDFVVLAHDTEVQAKEVVDEAERVVRVQECLSDALLVRVGSENRKLREHADRVELNVLWV